MRGAHRSLKPRPRPMRKVDPRAHATQSAYRKVDAWMRKLAAAWRAGNLALADLREGIVAVADVAQDEYDVPVRAAVVSLGDAHRVTVQVGNEGGLLLSYVVTLHAIANEPDPSESEYRARRFKPLGAWHNCEPEVNG